MEDDVWICSLSKANTYKVNAAYRVLREEDNEADNLDSPLLWAIWHKCIPQKLKTLLISYGGVHELIKFGQGSIGGRASTQVLAYHGKKSSCSFPNSRIRSGRSFGRQLVLPSFGIYGAAEMNKSSVTASCGTTNSSLSFKLEPMNG
ncbi:hypothetical protein Ancab_004558 [Ancistrocladus abbreviatus]